LEIMQSPSVQSALFLVRRLEKISWRSILEGSKSLVPDFEPFTVESSVRSPEKGFSSLGPGENDSGKKDGRPERCRNPRQHPSQRDALSKPRQLRESLPRERRCECEPVGDPWDSGRAVQWPTTTQRCAARGTGERRSKRNKPAVEASLKGRERRGEICCLRIECGKKQRRPTSPR